MRSGKQRGGRAAGLLLAAVLWLAASSARGGEGWRSNVVSIALGPAFGITDYTVRLGNPVDAWATRKPGISFLGDYQRRLHPLIAVGGYLELESFALERGAASTGGTRYGTGGVFLLRYPDWLVSFEAGGTVGLGIVEVGEVRALGVDYGLLFGPAFQYRWAGVALHTSATRGWYPGSSQLDEVTVDQIRVRLVLRLVL